MKEVPYGSSGVRVGQLALGCMGMSGYVGRDDGQSIRVLHAALDRGVSLLDTSVGYGSGHNQELIGKALKDRRERAIVHSKFGVRRDASGKVLGVFADPAIVRSDCEESLTRFGFDVIDVWCPSRVDLVAPIEDTVGEMVRLKEEGKIRFLALSEASPETIRRANAVHPVVSLQFEYSLLTRDAEAGNLQACRAHKMALMAYAPLCRGLLAHAVSNNAEISAGDNRKTHPRFAEGNLEANLTLVAAVEEVARSRSATPAQVALAWLMAQDDAVVPIPGAKTLAHLEDNMGAAELELSAGDVAHLSAAIPPGAAAGTRYPERELARLNV
jgi:aryl-alcohol dehydrogenase-like predicted oxidoreductase